jgi:hypothetical protein
MDRPRTIDVMCVKATVVRVWIAEALRLAPFATIDAVFVAAMVRLVAINTIVKINCWALLAMMFVMCVEAMVGCVERLRWSPFRCLTHYLCRTIMFGL